MLWEPEEVTVDFAAVVLALALAAIGVLIKDNRIWACVLAACCVIGFGYGMISLSDKNDNLLVLVVQLACDVGLSISVIATGVLGTEVFNSLNEPTERNDR